MRYEGRLAGMAFRDRYELRATELERAAQIVDELNREG